MIKDRITEGEIATTPSSCIDCLATDLSWEIYYIMKEKEEADAVKEKEKGLIVT
jgi:hypothetical protein